jgi:hypothetical protein
MSLLYKLNPEKITHKKISFYDYVNSKDINTFEIIISRLSPYFDFKKSFNGDKLTFEGCLLRNPICELPKFGNFWYKSFNAHRVNRFHIHFNTNDIDEINYESYLGKISNINKKFKTNYQKPDKDFLGYPTRNQDMNYGCLYVSNPNSLNPLPNGINIYGTYKKYLNYLYENVVNSDVEIFFTLAFQKIEEWNFFPIVDMSLRSWGQHLLDDHHLQEVIKDEIFTWHSGEEFPKHTKILK